MTTKDAVISKHFPGSSAKKVSNKDAGQRGKKAEEKVNAILKRWNEKAGFAYFRLPDARAAMGRLAAQPGDFVYYHGGILDPDWSGIIEVKSTAHNFRIAKDKISQLATLKKLEAAGARSVILVWHTESDVWRAIDPCDLEDGVPSWDLSRFPAWKDAETALLSMRYFQ